MSSSFPRYSTTSAVAEIDAAPDEPAPTSRCSGRKPIVAVRPALPPSVSLKRGGRGIEIPGASSDAFAPSPATLPSTKFIAGLPMKPATNLFAGRS